MTGLVYKSTGSWYTVKTELGETYECRIKGKFRIKGIKSTNPISVGDIVDFELETDNNQVSGIIHNIHDRQNYMFENRLIYRNNIILSLPILIKQF